MVSSKSAKDCKIHLEVMSFSSTNMESLTFNDNIYYKK